MKKRTLLLLIILLLGIILVLCCKHGTDQDEPEIVFRYINKLAVNVEILTLDGYGDTTQPFGTILQNDTLVFQKDFNFYFNANYCISVTFNDDTNKCVLFSGPIHNDTMDPRSESAYARIQDYQFDIDSVLYGLSLKCE
jgi:hypothetical protein